MFGIQAPTVCKNWTQWSDFGDTAQKLDKKNHK